MDFEIKPRLLFYVKLYLTNIFLLGMLSCENNISKAPTYQTKAEVDSILIWINEGRNDNNSRVIREKFLQKATTQTNKVIADSVKLKYFSKIQWSYLSLDNPLEFRRINKEARHLAHELGDSVRLAGAHWDLALFLERKSIKDSAYFHYFHAQKIYSSLGKQLNAGRLLYYMALIQVEIKDYTGSEINSINAIKELKPLNEYKDLYDCYNLLGIITKDLKEHERSLSYYKQAHQYLEKLENRNKLISTENNNIGVVYKEMGQFENAIPYFEKVISSESIRIKEPKLFARALTNLAESRYKLKSDTGVESLLNEALIIRDSVQDFAGMAGSYFTLADYFLYEKDTAKSLVNAKLAKNYAEQSNNNERLLEALRLLIRADRKNTTAHAYQYFSLNDSLQLAERQLRDKFTRISFETDEVVAKNESLTKEKRLWAGIAIGFLLLGFSIYLTADQRIKNQKLRFQQQQQTNNQEIFNLMLSQSQKLEEGKKIEQKRISEELHDGVLGKMLGARMLLTGLNKKSDDLAINQRATAIEALKNVEGEVRSISHELSHAAYQKIHNFISSFQDLLDDIGQNAQIDCNFTYSNNLDWDGLSGDIKINVYRIVQECLQNTVKHASCKKVQVDFNAEDENFKIQINDDGKGFEFKKAKRGIGIRNIESRVLKLNGTWNVDSKIGTGTSIVINIPIKYYDNALELSDNGITLNKV